VTCIASNSGTLSAPNPEMIERDRQRVRAFIAAQDEHDRLLELIGPLEAPYPLPRCGYCGSFGARDTWRNCPKCP
jgi:hypothetical protein